MTDQPTIYTGLDLHKRTITATTIDTSGHVLSRSRLPCRADVLRSYFASTTTDGRDHLVAMEATLGWYWVADALSESGLDVRLAHSHRVKAITSAKNKTDGIDSLTLAQLLRTDYLPEAHMISAEMRPWRDLLRTRTTVVDRSISAQNSIARLLEKMNVRSVEDLPATMQFQAQIHQDQIALCNRQVKALEKMIDHELVPDPIVQRLLRIPGIGKINALSIRLEVDDITRFASDRSFFSYCRLVPGANNSGEKVKHKRSKDGNRYLKITFSHASIRAIQYYPEIKRWYERKKRKKPDSVARALVAKELARMVYHVWTKQEDYNGQFKGVPLSRVKKEQWPLLRNPRLPLPPEERSP